MAKKKKFDSNYTKDDVRAYLATKGPNVLAKYDAIQAQKKRKKQKPINVNALDYYYCKKCDRLHKKYRGSDGKKIKIFQNHKEHAKKISADELFRLRFKASWRRQAKQQQKDKKPIGLPKSDKRKRNLYK